jgi:hypothetical protein
MESPMAKNSESIASGSLSSERKTGESGIREKQLNSMKKLLTWYAQSDIVRPGFQFEDYAEYGIEGNMRRNTLRESLLEDQDAFLDLMEEGFGDWTDRTEPIFQLSASIVVDFTSIQNHITATSTTIFHSVNNEKMIEYLHIYTHSMAVFLINMCLILKIKEEPEYQKFLINFLNENGELPEDLFNIQRKC